MINKGNLAISKKYEKLIVSLRTVQANEYSLDKEQTSYNDQLDRLTFNERLYYKIESNS